MTLRRYQQMRDFARTPEPRGEAPQASGPGRFVIQKHAATRLHYDFRLELDGVLKSWAVPKGPSMNPQDRRLAVHVEDHPVEYGGFEGTIPKGQYGGGTVALWDRGHWYPEHDPAHGLKKGHLQFRLDGEKLQGSFSLVRMHDSDNWLLIKADDDAANKDGEFLVRDRPESVATGRTLADIAADAGQSRTKAAAAKKTTNKPATKKTTKKTATKKIAAKKVTPKTAAKKHIKKTATKTNATRKTTTAKKVRKTTSAKKLRKTTTAKKVHKTTAAKKTRKTATKQTRDKPDAPPATILPELATLVDEVPIGDNWLHEIKYDGYRLIARIDGDHINLLTRKQEDWSDRLPWLTEALRAQIRVDGAVLDGELVHLGDDGITRFGALQKALSDQQHASLVFYAFDLLHLQGVDLRHNPLVERKQALAALLADLPAHGRIRLSEHVLGRGDRLMARACKLGLEGVMSKRADSAYTAGRHHDWLKIKCSRRQEIVIGGFTEARSGPRRVGALLMGVYDDDGQFIYSGKVGTGFDHATASDLRDSLDAVAAKHSPFLKTPPGFARSKFVRPELVAEVEFTEWTADGCLRHPVFVGLREDKRARDVHRERPESSDEPATSRTSKPTTPQRATSEKPAPHKKTSQSTKNSTMILGVALTHPDRVLYPDDDLTKQDIAAYYESLAEWILPALVSRPLSVLRCPDGICPADAKRCFFQKHLQHALPPGLHTVDLDDSHAPYIYIKNAKGLVALTQVGVLELHTWGSKIDHPGDPDRMTFDLDPGPGVQWSFIKDTAAALRTRLEALDLASFLKTTGGKGLHIVVPLTRGRQTWTDVKNFSHAIAREFAAAAPRLFTATASKAGRAGKIYLDYLRNSRGATAIAPYSTRARPGAPVAVPLRWDELAALDSPDQYTVKNLARRLAALTADPWAELPRTRQSLRPEILRAVIGQRAA